MLVNFYVACWLQELEVHRVKLMQDIASNRQITRTLESNLLEKLLNTECCIVDDAEFIELNKETKVTPSDGCLK
jgi:hypothetical protein